MLYKNIIQFVYHFFLGLPISIEAFDDSFEIRPTLILFLRVM